MKTAEEIMPRDDLRRLQLIELDILLELDRICRENDIQYYISAGTLLGAVRHKGFIPWDDDLDVYMYRGEYEKFCEVCKTKMNTEKYFLQNAETDQAYRWGYAKIRRKGTEYVRRGQETIKCMTGVSIDIFVIDHFPDLLPVRLLHYLLRRACIKTLYSVVGAAGDPNRLKRFIYRGLRKIDKNIPLSILEWMGKTANKRPSRAIGCTAFYRNDRWYKKSKFVKYKDYEVKADWFKERVEIEFEGFLFFSCKEYSHYLRVKYGDYWKYPPVSKRYLHAPSRYFLDVDIDLRGRDVGEYMNKDPFFM